MELNYHYDTLEPIAGAPYRVKFANGEVREGVLDANGHAVLLNPPAGNYVVEYGEDPKPFEPPDDAEDKSYQSPQQQQALKAEMEREHLLNQGDA